MSGFDIISIGEVNEAFFIRVWKALLSKHVLKTLRGSPIGKTQRRQYLLAVGLDGRLHIPYLFIYLWNDCRRIQVVLSMRSVKANFILVILTSELQSKEHYFPSICNVFICLPVSLFCI